jgi:hypothetical protein
LSFNHAGGQIVAAPASEAIDLVIVLGASGDKPRRGLGKW